MHEADTLPILRRSGKPVRASLLDQLNRAHHSQASTKLMLNAASRTPDLRGFVVGISQRWVLVQSFAEAVFFDGYEAVRIHDVTAVVEEPAGGFVERATASLGRPAANFQLPAYAATADVLNLATRQTGMVCLDIDAGEDFGFVVGRVVHCTRRKFDIQLIDPDGVWEVDVARLWYGSVTRVTFGDRYSLALEAFGEERPEPGRHRNLRSFCRE